MKNKIDFLIVIDWLVTPLMEIGAEIALEKASQKKEIVVLIIDDYLKSEGYNSRLPSFLSRYDIPKKLEKVIFSKNHKNIKLFRKKISQDIHQKLWPKEILIAYNKIKRDELKPINKILKNLYLNNINVGEGILSSIISLTKNKFPIFQKDKKSINEIFNLFVRRYKTYSDFFKGEIELKNVAIFNGRFASSKAIESCINKYLPNTKLLYYERSQNLYRYTLRTFRSHNREEVFKEINKTWDKCKNKNEASQIAKTFFKIRISGHGTDWFPFSNGIHESQKTYNSKKLNNYFEHGENQIISYFTSSEDEFESLGDIWLDKRFKLSQKKLIEELSRISIKKNIILIIRLHPNHKNSSDLTRSYWSNILNKLPIKNTLIIKDNENISSYKIIKNSDLVIVYGSTIGIEALFLEKPVIITGSSFYFGTKAKIKPVFDISDLEKNIDNLLLDISPNNSYKKVLKESSFPYGYWAYTHGSKYKYFYPSTPTRGLLINKDLQKLHRILSKIKTYLKHLFFHGISNE